MIEILAWLAALIGVTIAASPIAFRFFGGWLGGGWAFYRPFALILVGFTFWILGVLGLIPNSGAGVLVAVLIVALVSIWVLHGNKKQFISEISRSQRSILLRELIFGIGFLIVVLIRGTNPDIAGTEKPMEMMFINSILRSDTLPPADGWLSGYSISYYYFGYLITALLVQLSRVPSEVGFNLMLATVFGMASAGAFELVNEWLNQRAGHRQDHVRIFGGALFAPVFVLILGNLEGLFESLHSLHIGWTAEGTSGFWSWLGLKELVDAPRLSASIDPTARPGIWWWRASRVLSDMGLDGTSHEVIDEFPFFSFYLGDLHPHVIAIPFVLLAIAAGWTLFRAASNEARLDWARITVHSAIRAWGRLIQRYEFWIGALVIGGSLFMNTWDFPFLFLLTVAAVAIALNRGLFPFGGFFRTAVWLAIPFGVACLGLYGLFMEGLASQAGGILPSGVYTTRFVHFLIMFGAAVIPTFGWLAVCSRRANVGAALRRVGSWVGFIFIILSTVTILLWFMLWRASTTGGSLGDIGRLFMSGQGATQSANPFMDFLVRRLSTIGTSLILATMIALALAISARRVTDGTEVALGERIGFQADADRFMGLIVALAAGLVLFPEFFYLRDFFGTRMNTIFKFYYLAWILFGLASAYGVQRLFDCLTGAKKGAFALVLGVLVFSAGVYSFWGFTTKINALMGTKDFSLNGARFVADGRADDWATVSFLRGAPAGTIVEKVGGSYSADNVFSIFSGLPTLLGPINHESQWRGGYTEMGSRNEDVKTIYESKDWRRVSELLERYGVRYVVIGSAERSAYTVAEAKFETYLTLVFKSGANRVYFVR